MNTPSPFPTSSFQPLVSHLSFLKLVILFVGKLAKVTPKIPDILRNLYRNCIVFVYF